MLHPLVTLFFSFAILGYFLQIQHENSSFSTSISIHDAESLAL